MENFSWLNAFREMGRKVREELEELFKGTSAGKAVGKGAGGDTTLVLDKRAEDAIVLLLEKLHASGEDFSFISEELGERSFGEGGVVILADPIDGSNNAKYGIPFFSTALAMSTGRKLSDVGLGYIINHGNGDEFWAIKGQGAYKNGIRIKTSGSSEIGMLNFEGSSPKRDIMAALPLLSAAHKVRCLGTTALDLACLASGATDAVLVPSPSRSFDYAAGWLLVKEAGGIVTDTSGNALDETPLGIDRTTPFIGAATEALLAKALSALKGGS
ncbi:MAG: inositol monophosphatase family protein [Nitrospirota bacterium]